MLRDIVGICLIVVIVEFASRLRRPAFTSSETVLCLARFGAASKISQSSPTSSQRLEASD
ncbi:hypothetical protein LINPERHAP1_LOCUS3242 [Linum perenne]